MEAEGVSYTHLGAKHGRKPKGPLTMTRMGGVTTLMDDAITVMMHDTSMSCITNHNTNRILHTTPDPPLLQCNMRWAKLRLRIPDGGIHIGRRNNHHLHMHTSTTRSLHILLDDETIVTALTNYTTSRGEEPRQIKIHRVRIWRFII